MTEIEKIRAALLRARKVAKSNSTERDIEPFAKFVAQEMTSDQM
jgi:hypothetical protein